MLILLVGLGEWQVQRLHWKQNILTTIDRQIHQAPVDLFSLLDRDDNNYRPVLTSGRFLNDKTFYLLAISQAGVGGYDVLTPLLTTEGHYLLVNRGWIPYANKSSADYLRPLSTVNIEGILRRPEHSWLQSKNDPSHNVWYWIDFPAMAQAADLPDFLPYVLDIEASPAEGSYPIGGQTRVTLPNNHFVYAITWFGLAFALLVIYFLSSFPKDAED